MLSFLLSVLAFVCMEFEPCANGSTAGTDYGGYFILGPFFLIMIALQLTLIESLRGYC